MDRAGLASRIREAIQESPLDQRELASRVGVSANTISNYVQAKSVPDALTMAAIARETDRPMSFFVDVPDDDGVRMSDGGIPVVSRIRAGLMSLYEVERYAEETVPVSEELIARPGERLFGLRVEGDSMSPFMLPGDVVICSTVRGYEVGDDVAYYRQSSGESTVKRIEALDRKTGRVRLRPLNPEYDSFTVQLERGDQMAPVVGLYRETTRPRRTAPFQ